MCCFCFVVGLLLVVFLFFFWGFVLFFFVVGFVFVSSCVFCLFVLEFFLLFGLFLFCFVCLLEWSRWCSCFVHFVLFMFTFYFWLFLSVSYEDHWFHCNSSVFLVYKKSISAYHFNSWFLLFVFGLLVVCFFIIFCFASCFLVVFFYFVALVFCYFLIFGYLSRNISPKFEVPKTPTMKMQRKTNMLTRAISTRVFTKRFFILFACLKILHALLKTL